MKIGAHKEFWHFDKSMPEHGQPPTSSGNARHWLAVPAIFILLAGFPIYGEYLSKFIHIDSAKGAFLPGTGKPAPDFQLRDSHDRVRSLQNFRGQYVLLYFGYIHCTGVCPRTFSELKKLTNLKPATQILFLSLDPERDSPGAQRTFEKEFNSRLLALQAQPEYMHEVAGFYGQYYQYDLEKTHTADFQFDHADISYLIDPQGRLRARYRHPLASDMAHDIELLKKSYRIKNKR